MRDISGADFRFAKTLTLPFFGSGMVELPPGGTKRVKNSRKMQMVFFVFYGRVTVDLGTPAQRFSIGRGGMWQVPRGKPYFHAVFRFQSLRAISICSLVRLLGGEATFRVGSDRFMVWSFGAESGRQPNLI